MKRFSSIHNQKFVLPCELSPTVCCRPSSDWRWLAVDGVSAVLRSERMGMYVEANLNCPMSRFIVRSCPRWMSNGLPGSSLVNLLLSLDKNLALFFLLLSDRKTADTPVYGESTPVRRSLQQYSRRIFAHKVKQIFSNRNLPIKWTSSRITRLNIGKMWPMAAFFSKGPQCGVPAVFPQHTICQGA